MYLTKANLFNFGHFRNRVLDFGAGLNIIVGPNEAGKSTLVEFLRYMLLGKTHRVAIPTLDNSHPVGLLWLNDGTLVERKNYKMSNGSPDALELGATPSVFRDVFTFDLGDLHRLSDLGDGDRVFMGALSESIRKYKFAVNSLKARIDQLYKPRSTNAVLRALEAQESVLLSRLKEAERHSGRYTQIFAEIAEKKVSHARLELELDAYRNEQRFCGQLVENFETYLRQQEAMDKLASFSPFIVQATEFEQLRELHTQIQTESQKIDVLARQLAIKTEQLKTWAVDERLLTVGPELQRLVTQFDVTNGYDFVTQRATLEREQANLAQALRNLGAGSAADLPIWTTGQQALLREAARLELERTQQDRIMVEKQQLVTAQQGMFQELVVNETVERCATAIEALPDVLQYEMNANRSAELNAQIGELVVEHRATNADVQREAMVDLSHLAQTFPIAAAKAEQLTNEVETRRQRLQDTSNAVKAIVLAPLDANRVHDLNEAIPDALTSAAQENQHSATAESQTRRIRQLCETINFDFANIEQFEFTGELRSQLEAVATELQQRKSALAIAQDDFAAFGDVADLKLENLDAVKHRLEKLKLLEQLCQNRIAPKKQNRLATWALALSIIALIVVSVLTQNYIVAGGLVVVALIAIWFSRSGKTAENSNQDADILFQELRLPTTTTVVEILHARQAEEKSFDDLSKVATRLEQKHNAARTVDSRKSSLLITQEQWTTLTAALPVIIPVDHARETLNALQDIQKTRHERLESLRLVNDCREKQQRFLTSYKAELQAFGVVGVNRELSTKISNWLQTTATFELKQHEQDQAANELQRCLEESGKAQSRLDAIKEDATRLGYRGELTELQQKLNEAQRHFNLADQIAAANTEIARHTSAQSPTQDRIALIRSALDFSGSDPELIQYAKTLLTEAKSLRARWTAEKIKLDDQARELKAATERLDDIEKTIAHSKLAWASAQANTLILQHASPADIDHIVEKVGTLHQAAQRVEALRAAIAAAEIKRQAVSDDLIVIRDSFGEQAPLESWLPVVLEALKGANTACTKRDQTLQECSALQVEIDSHRSHLLSLEAELTSALEYHECSSFMEFEQRREDGQNHQQIKTSLEANERTLRKVFGVRTEDALEAFEIADALAWTTKVESLTVAIAELREQSSCVTQEIGVLTNTLNDLQNNADIPAIELELVMVHSEIHNAQLELAELLVAKTLLEDTLETYRNVHLPAVLKTAGRMIKSATEGAYVGLTPTDDGKDIIIEDAAGNTRNATELSRGTRELVFIAIRLALAMDYAARDIHMPIIMDDVMVNLDEERAAQMAKLIAAVGEEHQIFFMTCNPYTSEILKNACADYNEIPIDRFDGAGQPMVFTKPKVVAQKFDELTPEAIEAVLRDADEPLGKNEILEQLNADDSSWQTVIKSLKDDKIVQQIGDKRGARYCLATNNDEVVA